MFSETLGIRPWEWDLLNAHEALSLIDYIDNQIKEARKHGP